MSERLRHGNIGDQHHASHGANSASVLSVQDLHAGYGAQTVLRGVSLEVQAGAITGLLGPNGHGKTTLLRCVSGLLQPLKGQVQFKGQNLMGLRPEWIAAQGLGQVPQGDMLFSRMSVQDNLLMGAYLRPAWVHRETNLRRVFALFPRLQERLQQSAGTLSGGERRMLSIGRGLMSCAQLLMIDEPSLGLAPKVIEDIYVAIVRLAEEGMPILLVEESVERVAEVCRQVYLLDDGLIRWQGTAAELDGNADLISAYLGS